MRKLISVLFICIMSITGSLVMAKAEGGASITYQFKNDLAGYAEGTITLTADTAGTYALYWADDTAALDGWFAIASMELKAGGQESYAFSDRAAIPASATKLIAVKKGDKATVDNAAAVFDIPASKQFPHHADERSYRFGALSDIHIDMQDGGKAPYYLNAAKNFALALNVCADRAADFIISAGDQITNASGAALEWLEYQRIIADSSYDNPIYEAIGNHELRYADLCHCDPACGVEEFIANTGLDGTRQTMERRKPYFEVTEPATGDHFLFMALEYSVNPAEHDEFSDEQMEWVEGLLKEYTGDGHKIFLIQHAGITGYGAGDDRDDPAYGGSLNTEFKNNARFKKLLETYKDVIWFSGHTHVDFEDNVNYSDEGGSACRMFHIPSVANTTRLSTDVFGEHELDRAFHDDTTQGYLVDVYPGATLLCGVNFYYNKQYPAYTYIVDAKASPTPTASDKRSQKPAAPVSADILKEAKAELSAYHQYASYPAYAALKRACRTKIGVEAALEDFKALCARTKLTTVWFADSEKMDTVRAYAWNHISGESIEPLPGQKATAVKVDASGRHVYAVTVDAARYDRIRFSDGDHKKTADIPLTDGSGRVCCPESFESPYQAHRSARHKTRGEAIKTSAVYFTDPADRGKVNIYAWATEQEARTGIERLLERRYSFSEPICQAIIPQDSKAITAEGAVKTIDVHAIDDANWQIVGYRN